MRISDFVNDNQSECWTRFKKDKLLDLLDRLELPENIVVSSFNRTHIFNHEELLVYLLTKLAYSLSHTIIADMIFGGDSAQ